MEARPTQRSLMIGALLAVTMLGSACGGIQVLRVEKPAKPYDRQACVENALRADPDMATLPLALEQFTRECEKDNNPAACSQLGIMYELGLAVPADGVRAASFYHRACKAENVGGCVNLGWAYAKAVGVEIDNARAMRLLDWGCRKGNMRGCTEQATMLLTAQDVAKDAARASKLYKRACDDGFAAACYQLGAMHEHGGEAAANTMTALTAYEAACLAGNPKGCDGMARMYAKKPAAPKAHPSLAGCEDGSAADCAAVGMAYYKGDMVERNVETAVTFLQRACSGGYGPSCAILGPTLHGSCARGNSDSCRALGKLASVSPR